MAAATGRACDGRSHSRAIDVSQLKDFDLTVYTLVPHSGRIQCQIGSVIARKRLAIQKLLETGGLLLVTLFWF